MRDVNSSHLLHVLWPRWDANHVIIIMSATDNNKFIWFGWTQGININDAVRRTHPLYLLFISLWYNTRQALQEDTFKNENSY